MSTLTPSEWFDLLNAKFNEITRPKWQDHRSRSEIAACSREVQPRHRLLDTLWSYYVGDPPLPQVADEYKDVFRDVMRKARSNYAPMAVAAMLDRMELLAVSTAVDKDLNGDDLAARIMDESGFAAMFKDLLGYLFAMGESYAMVVPGSPTPTIHAIDPRRCVGIPDPQNPVRLIAALVKEYDEIEKEEVAHLFLPGRRWRLTLDGVSWRRGTEEPELIRGLDEFGGIPIVRFENAFGLGEYEPHIDLLDRINDTTLQRIVGFWYQALRQRAFRGDLEDGEDEYGEDTPVSAEDQMDSLRRSLKAGPGSLWMIPKDFEIWESAQADFSPIINAKRDDVKEFAAVTSTPLHLITPDAANGSAEGAGLMRESATAKVRDRRARVTPQMKLLWRIVFAMAGEPRRGDYLKLHWGPIEFRTLAEMASASSQAQGTLSVEKIGEKIWQMTPDEIDENIKQLGLPKKRFEPPSDDSNDNPAVQPDQ
ncbi:portal protein [Mycobacterium phage Cornie]|uniref:Portal protein n=1 Tax=Mycobacterium phage Cornie TaxID=2704043 RepID=A0A6G6XJU2_9CAUD|nr:portal protein [Mycobacterium phage Cornie]QIG58381.1 portal protein [Mycobacterium phage Cornie]